MSELSVALPPAVSQEPSVASTARPWSLAHRIGFRFAFVFLALRIAPFPLNAPPKTDFLDEGWNALWSAVVPWVGAHVLHLAQPVINHPTGSGDSLFSWVRFVCELGLAALATSVWSVVDRRRASYATLDAWLRIMVRYWLGWTILIYGFSKVFHEQMPWSPEKMLEPYGEFSPMGLAWTFMGYSAAYSAFAGALEVLGGALLFFARTATAGALLLIAVMSNVVMMNLCFDIPVKLHSTLLLLMAIYVAGPDLGRLFRAVLGRGAIAASERPNLFADRRLWVAGLICQWMMIAQAAWNYGYDHFHSPRAAWRTPTLASGLYQLESIDHAPIPNYQPAVSATAAASPSPAQAARFGMATSDELLKAPWARVAISRFAMGVLFSDGSYRSFGLMPENAQPVLTLAGPQTAVLKYRKPDGDHLVLEGDVGPQHVTARLKRLDEGAFTLRSRPFTWVQEYPFNR